MRAAFGIVMVALLVVTGSIGLTLSAGYAQIPQGTGTPVPPLDGTAGSLLSRCPCQPVDRERFNGFIYPSELSMTPATDPGWTDEQLRTEIASLLDERFLNRPPDVKERALDVYGQATAMMDVRLAAAVVMLVGTSGEPAVDVILEGEWSALGFGEMTRPEWTAEPDQSGPWAITINEQWIHEDFLWLSSILMHEALHAHRGDGVGREEEAAAFLLQRIVLAELLAEYPEIAAQKTSLSRSQLTFLLGQVYNSSTVFDSRGEGLYPGGNVDAATMWEDGPASQYREFQTIAPPVLGEILANLGIPASGAPDLNDDGIPDFTTGLLDLLVVDQIIDTPESRLTGDTVQLLGEEVLTIEFAGAEPVGPPTPSPVPTVMPGVTLPGGLTLPAAPTPDFGDIVPSQPDPQSPPPSQPRPPAPPAPPPPTQPPAPPPVVPTSPPQPVPTSPPEPDPIPTTAPPAPIPTTAPPQEIEDDPPPPPNELGRSDFFIVS